MLLFFSRILVIAAIHFAACRLVVWAAMQMGMFAAGGGHATGFFGHALVLLTRILYFPILTLALYSRHWFPGNWIWVPMIANSLIWGLVLYGGYRLARYLKPKLSSAG